MAKLAFCGACQKQIDADVSVCPHCSAPRRPGRRYKDRATAGILAIFLGGLGIHRFYLGQWWGLAYLLLSWTMLPLVIALVEGIVFLCMSQERWDAKYNDGVPTANESSRIGLLIVLAAVGFIGLAVLGILAAIAVPAYADYVARSKVVGALGSAHQAALAVQTYVEEKGALPGSLAEAGFNAPLPPNVHSIELDDTNGDVVVTMAGEPFDHSSFALSPVSDSGDAIAWRCRAIDIRERYLPTRCRAGSVEGSGELR
jgi:TM2 domain-containing membrane protein YozV/Tfp pilus assembly major pilin PilA